MNRRPSPSLFWILGLCTLALGLVLVVADLLAPSEVAAPSPTVSSTTEDPLDGAGREEPTGPATPREPVPVPSDPVLWATSFESEDFSDFYDITTNGCTDRDVVSSPVRSGSFAGALTVCDGEGGIRLRVEDLVEETSLPDDAYYSAWFNLPDTWSGDDANIFQFKQAVTYDGGETQTKEVLFSIQADWTGDDWELRLKSKIDQSDGSWDGEQRVLGDGVHVPRGEWFHIEARYVWSKTKEGRVTVWVNGEEVWDLDGLYTEVDWPEITRPRQWTVNHYVGRSKPGRTTLYVDDVAVTLRPIREIEGERSS